LVGLVAGILWFPLFQKGAEIRAILSDAKSVSLVEYRAVTEDLVYSDELARKTLSPDQIKTISSAFRGLGWMDGAKACEFEPHHTLICTMPDGMTRNIHICFSCNDVAIDSGRPFDIHSWAPAVKAAIEGCGVPVRADIYRFGP
jgi:hypothetical protein